MSEPRRGEGYLATGLLTAAGAALAGALVAATNLIGVAVVLGLVLAVSLTRVQSRKLVIVCLVAVLLARSLEIGSGFAPTTYTDEVVTLYLFVVLVGRRMLSRRPLRRPPGTWMFAAFAAFGVLSSVISDVPLGITAAGALLALKGVLLFFAIAQVDWTSEDVPWLARTGAWVLVAALVCGLVNLLVPGPWTSVLSVTGHSQYRTFLPSLIGPFTHPLQYGNFMSLMSIACAAPLLYWARVQHTAKGGRALFIASVLATVLSFRRTAIVGMLAGLSFLVLRRRNASLLVTAALMLPLAGVALYPLVHEVATSTYDAFVVQGADNARTRMTIDSLALGFQHFPLGVGFGRFGSATAAEHYSIEYLRLGYGAIRGLGGPADVHNHGRFLTDTQWPAIVAEPGILGAGFFAAGLWRIFGTFRRANRVADLPVALLGLIGMGWTVHVLLESVAYPVFVTAPTSPLLFGLAGITAAMVAARSRTATGPESVQGPQAGDAVLGSEEQPVPEAPVDRHRPRSAGVAPIRPRRGSPWPM